MIELLGGLDNCATVNGQLRQYGEGHWKKVDTNLLKAQTKIHYEEMLQYVVDQALKSVKMMAYKPSFGMTAGVDPSTDPKSHRVCLLNGTYDLMDRKLIKHDPSHQLLWQLNINWDDAAECPNYDKFMGQAFEDERSINCWNEYAALTLVPNTAYHKMMSVSYTHMTLPTKA